MSRREEWARRQCSVPSLAPVIYELVRAWRAMSHICPRAARRNTPTALSPWSAMSFSLCGHSGRPGGLLARHVSHFQAQTLGMAPRCPPRMVCHVFPHTAMNERFPHMLVSLNLDMPTPDGLP